MKDITESIENIFEGSKLSNNTVSGVVLFGTSKNANNRVYTDNAVDNLVTLAEGNKAFVDHPTERELKNRQGVRSVRDFMGTFKNARRDNDKIRADLTVRESYKGLISDIIKMAPKDVGFSINAQVRVKENEEQEVIEEVVRLRSCDLVSQAATVSGIFESYQDVGLTEEEKEKELKEAKESFEAEIEGRKGFDIDEAGSGFMEDVR